jgi:type IV pilus assembly protein PilO
MVNFKQLPYVAQIGLVAAAVLLLAGVVFFIELLPIVKENQADAIVLKARQAEVARLTPYKTKLADLNAQTEALKIKMEEQRKVVPDEAEVPSLITLVAGEAAASGVEVRRYTPRDTTSKEYYVEVPIDIDVDGPYYSVLNFFDRLKDHPPKLQRIVNVSKLTMGALKAGKGGAKGAYKWAPDETVSANCLLTTFYSTSKGGTPPAAAKK